MLSGMMTRTLEVIIAAIFIFVVAPLLGTQAAAYAAQTSPSPNATLVIFFNLFAWVIPIGLAVSLLAYAFKQSD